VALVPDTTVLSLTSPALEVITGWIMRHVEH
jgi:hypothetical protein